MARKFFTHHRQMFKAIFSNGLGVSETIPTSDYNRALSAMNELLTNYRHSDCGIVTCDATYDKGIPQVWLNRHPDAIALRVLHVRNYNSYKRERLIIGKVVIC